MDTVINGHSPVTMKFQDLVDFGEFNRLFLEHARASLKAGKTPEQAMMDLKLPEKFKDYNLTGGRGGPGGNFGVIFTEASREITEAHQHEGLRGLRACISVRLYSPTDQSGAPTHDRILPDLRVLRDRRRLRVRRTQ